MLNVLRFHHAAMYVCKAIQILAKGYLSISLLTPLKLQEIIDKVTIAI